MEVPAQTLYKELRSMGQGVHSIRAFDKLKVVVLLKN